MIKNIAAAVLTVTLFGCASSTVSKVAEGDEYYARGVKLSKMQVLDFWLIQLKQDNKRLSSQVTLAIALSREFRRDVFVNVSTNGIFFVSYETMFGQEHVLTVSKSGDINFNHYKGMTVDEVAGELADVKIR